MAEQPKEDISHSVYRQVNPSGLASEVSAGRAASPATTAAFGQWLGERLGGGTEEEQRARRQHLGTLSGIGAFDLGRLIEGQVTFPFDADHIQRLATALLEMGAVAAPKDVWAAAGWDTVGTAEASSDYIVPPSQIVGSMRGET